MKKRGYIIGIAGAILLITAFLSIVDRNVLTGGVTIGEVIAGGAIILLIWGFFHAEQNADRSLLQKFWHLGFHVGLFWIGMTVLEKKHSFQASWSTGTATAAPGVIWYVIFAVVLILTIRIFILLRSLLFIEQSRPTSGNFWLLAIIMVLRIIQPLTEFGPDSTLYISSWEQDFNFSSSAGVLTILFLLLVFINGFRCKWVHYLNKRQKIGVFFAGMLVNGIAITVMPDLGQTVNEYSITAGVFIREVHTFFIIYSGMALFGLLFQLPSAGIMDKRMRQIRYLQNLGAELGSVLDKQELLSKSCILAGKMTGADVTWVELKNGSGCRLSWTAGLPGQYIEELPENLKGELREMVAGSEVALLVNDVKKDDACRRLAGGMIRAGSLLAAIVKNKDNSFGYIYTVSRNRFGFSEESRGLFRAFADQIGVALENSRLAQVSIEQEVYKEELRMAHDAQMRLLPREMPEIPGIDINAFCITANEIGGDFYDIIQVTPDRTDIVIGDVSGKGASAAFYMAEMKGLIQALAHHHTCPVDIMVEINGFIKKNFEPDTFVTMIYSILYQNEGRMVIARAGHPPAALVRENEIEWLEMKGLGLGLATNKFLRRILKKQELHLENGDKLIYLTDGLIEARNQAEEEYGEARYEEMLLETKDMSAAESLSEIRKSMTDFTGDKPRHDDVTLLAIRFLRD